MTTNYLTYVLIVAATASRLVAQEAAPLWSYQGAKGPDHWGDLKPEYRTCKAGMEQSPIDIRNPALQSLPVLAFDYSAVPLKIIDNGHSIQVNYSPGSFMTVAGARYELRQFHFHHPSEERIKGKSYPMAVHLVHADKDGKLAVVAIPLEKGPPNKTIQDIWTRLPKVKDVEQEAGAIAINAADLLPKQTGYFTYSGSLTTPPCTEGVTWFVLKTPVAISQGQIDIFSKLYPDNARPIQPTRGREVRASQ
ncbi:MAG TPA: carbonic anhydrase family protein [Bryobacteraceae bacterium]|jgi:carbonic anhydrase